MSRATSFQYNASGQVTQIDGPRTEVADLTTLTYYICTTGGSCGQLHTVTNALGQVTSYDLYDAHGRVLQMTGPNGLVTGYAYDLRGRLTAVTETPPSGPARVTAYAYDDAGQLETVTEPNGRVLTYGYDAAHDLRSVVDNLGNRLEYSYDLKGNRTEEITKDPAGTIQRSVQTSWDLRNRVDVINAAGSLTDLLYDAVGNLKSTTDPNSHATSHSYDPLNRLTQTLDALSGSTNYGYDPLDQLTQVQAPNGATTTYQYDDLGHLLALASPDTGVTGYAYDAAGNRLAMTDARGVTVAYTYDALNRLLSASYPDSSLDVSYSYDQGAGQKGRLTGITDGSGTTALVYDVFGNLLEDTRTIAAEVLQTSYSYDGAHQLMSVTYPSGRTMNYIRDTVGRITSVSTDFGGQNQTVLSSAQYLPFGPLAGFTFGNGIAVERPHDQQYRLEELTGGGVEDLTYAYDPGGNIDAIADNLNASFSRAFAQDALDRLTSDQGAFGTRTYQYDSVGNRTGRWLDASPEQAITVVSNSNRLATINAAAVSYDAAGNVLADGTGRTFGYNDLNRLATASISGQTVATYAYNAFGQRARKTETASSTSTVFAYAPGGQLLAERRLRSDGTRELEREYLWLDSLPIAMAERSYAADGTTVTASQLVYLHADHLDTPRLATDAAQRVVWRWRSDAFGIGAAETDPDGDSVTTEVPLRFPGQYLDAETGLHYNYFREYDPPAGRYLQADPIGLEGSLNTYAYVDSSPLTHVDPYGLNKYDKTFGLPKRFWNWYHRKVKKKGDPDLEKEEAEQLCEEWRQVGEPGPDNKSRQDGFADSDLLDWLIPWWLFASPAY